MFVFKIYIVIVTVLGLVSCSSSENNSKIKMEDRGPFSINQINDTLSYLSLGKDDSIDQWELPYPIFRFEQGDINQDGKIDALVGVIKTTRFDSTLGKRLFIFKNYQGFVRPLWLGSKLSQPLVDFRFVDGEIPVVRTIEKEKSGKYLVAEYKWRKFGLEFMRYLEREVDMNVGIRKLD